MNRLKCLDLYSCAGGASRGLAEAGFHVTGVDIDPQPKALFKESTCDAGCREVTRTSLQVSDSREGK